MYSGEFKIDLIVWKSWKSLFELFWAIVFKIDLIVWKLIRHPYFQP